jgi:hypothetical protein
LQLGVQQVPALHVCPDGQMPPVQVPPQPSPEPQALPRQSGSQQVPPWHGRPFGHDCAHMHESMQVPF